MRYSFRFLLLCLTFSYAPALLSQTPAAAGCTVEKGYYHCDKATFVAALKEAKTIAVVSRPFDQATTNSLGKLARTLNKTVVSSAADLTFVMIRTQSEGISFGPSDNELASFLVYSGNPQDTGSRLIWIETFYGEQDIVWPIVVYDILRQFKASIQ